MAVDEAAVELRNRRQPVQTLYSISSSARKKSEAELPVRVIVRGQDHEQAPEDDLWLQRVIRGVNTQNRVRAHDFRSNEPEQIELQKRFRSFNLFHERKRGEWKECRNEPRYRNFERLSLRALGQILTAVSDKTGRGVLTAKRGVEEVFGDKNYKKLFPSRAKVGKRFERYYFAYRVYRLLDWRGYKDAREYRKYRHAMWNTLWIMHLGMTNVPRLFSRTDPRRIRDTFDEFESGRASGRRAGTIVRKVVKAVWSAWRKSRRLDPERWTPNNFFKSQFGNRWLLSLALPPVRKDLQLLGRRVVH